MAKAYKPNTPFNVPFKISHSTKRFVNGVNKLEYQEETDVVYYCSAKAYVGTNKLVNNVSTEEDTMTVESWYNSSLKKNDRIRFLDDDSQWLVITTPENINRRNQYMVFKVIRYGE